MASLAEAQLISEKRIQQLYERLRAGELDQETVDEAVEAEHRALDLLERQMEGRQVQVQEMPSSIINASAVAPDN